MEKKSIWLILFAVVAIAAGYMWWSGGSTPKAEEPTEPVADSSLSDPDAPALGTGKEQIRPTVPGARQEAGTITPDPVSPNTRTAPAPGFTPPPTYESFNAPNNGTAEAPAPSRIEPPPSAFEPVPPQAFENPDFVTPPPPPPQFDTEPPPFEADQAPPPQNYDAPPPDGGNEFNPPPEPEGY